MKQLFLIGAALLALGASANAQQNNRNNNNGNNGGGILPLPEGVESVVSIDALGILMAQVNRDGKRDLAPIIVRHIYSGGVARLFGGDSVPTAQFVSPGQSGGNFSGQNGGQGNNGGNFGGQNGGFGGQNGGNFGGNTGNSGGFGGGNFGGGIANGGNTGGFGGGNFGAFQMRRIGRRGN